MKDIRIMVDGKCSKPFDMPEKPQHTPTPWKVAESLTNGEPNGQTLWLVTEDDETVANLSRIGAKAFEVQRANAAFIVRAVNCHEELIAKFGLILHHLKGIETDELTHNERKIQDIAIGVICAIAKAEKK